MLPLTRSSGAVHPASPLPVHPFPILPPHPLLVSPALLPVVFPAMTEQLLPDYQKRPVQSAAERLGRMGQQHSRDDPLAVGGEKIGQRVSS